MPIKLSSVVLLLVVSLSGCSSSHGSCPASETVPGADEERYVAPVIGADQGVDARPLPEAVAPLPTDPDGEAGDAPKDASAADATVDAGPPAASDPHLEECRGLGDPARQAGFFLVGCLVGGAQSDEADGFGASITATEDGVLIGGTNVDARGEERSALFFFAAEDGFQRSRSALLAPVLRAADTSFGAVAYDRSSHRIAVALPQKDAMDGAGNLVRAVGAVLLYQPGANHTWELLATLGPRQTDGTADLAAYAGFGDPLIFHQGDLVVGREALSFGNEYDNPPKPGALFIFRDTGGAFQLAGRLEPPAFTTRPGTWVDARYELFSDEDQLVVGSPSDDIASSCPNADNNAGRCRTGAVRSYRRAHDGSYGASELFLAAPQALFGTQFGASLAVWNGALVVGAPDGGSTGDSSRRGLVYALSGADRQSIEALPLPPVDWSAQFGRSLLAFDDLLLIGAPRDAPWNGRFVMRDGKLYQLAGIDVGSVFVYRRSAAGWAYEPLFLPFELRSAGVAFGRELARHGDYLFASIGPISRDDKRGRVLVYKRAPQ